MVHKFKLVVESWKRQT